MSNIYRWNISHPFTNTDVCLINRLAPEHPFSTSVSDSWDPLQWVIANTSSFSADPALGFIVRGTSARAIIPSVLPHFVRYVNLQPSYSSAPTLVPNKCPSGEIQARVPKRHRVVPNTSVLHYSYVVTSAKAMSRQPLCSLFSVSLPPRSG
jgi:hypothetical protein